MMTATDGVATSGSRPESVSATYRATYRRFRRMGFEDSVAANLTAVKNGFGIASQPWTVRELTHLLFLRELCRTGRRWSVLSDRASLFDGSGLPPFPLRRPAKPIGTQTWEPLPLMAYYLRAIGKEG